MYQLFTDGGSRGNPGAAACAAFLFDEKGLLVAFDAKYLGETTNNQAEYHGLLIGLKLASKNGVRLLQINMDSELIIQQLSGKYKVKDPGMKIQYDKVMAELGAFEEIKFQHVRREYNKFADRLVNLVLDTRILPA